MPAPPTLAVAPGLAGGFTAAVGFRVLGAFVLCLLLIDQPLAGFFRELPETAAGRICEGAALVANPIPIAAVAGLGWLALVAGARLAMFAATAERMRDHARRLLFVVVAWAGATVLVRSADVLLGGNTPREGLTALACGPGTVAADAVAYPFLAGRPETIVAVAAALAFAYPDARVVRVAAGLAAVAAFAVVCAARHYLGDVLLASLIAWGWAAFLHRAMPAVGPAPGEAAHPDR